MIKNLIILIPVFNDWPSFAKLVEEISQLNRKNSLESIHILAINDGSTLTPETKSLEQRQDKTQVSILHLNRNVGHQNAIAAGLGWVAQSEENFDAVVIMDGDGEDKPQDIAQLIDKAEANPGHIVIAARGRRNESLTFRMGYGVYKLLFRLFTGFRISFGNFSLIPTSCLTQLVNSREIWHSYAGGVLRSRIPRTMVQIDRGTRYYGQSKMNFTGLILHGLSAISVFVDICTVRVLMMTLGFITLSALGIGTVVTMKFLGLSSPGWSSTMALLMLVISMQCVLLSFFLIFILFIYRNMNTQIPVNASNTLVKDVSHSSSERIL
ncbi:MAG TPA: glycosyltransferase [Oligoflexus sp.]|uniref:glycosyltransferase n=1 Tax=Oligoflexus sp. TaxID=1971216 RepID=UPI002D7F8213|nr:glycosyltransferase [Oligoflexus sp.]HET9241543.1 glycosyltransferase [Oligoflexus sp.]